jgi:heavy metal sensor kinase
LFEEGAGSRRQRPRTNWIRGLRPRLTFSYVLFFTVLLSFLGVFFTTTLRTLYETQIRDLLSEEWGAIRGYLRVEKGTAYWVYDPQDPDETFTVERLRRVYLLTDADGKVIQVSTTYKALGIDSPEEIRRILKSGKENWETRQIPQLGNYIIRSGPLTEEKKTYFLAIGRATGDYVHVIEQFNRNYFLLLPLMILVGSLFGWFMAGRALQPLDKLANTAQRITSSNLSVQIPGRRANDELDRLIDSFNRMIERLDQSFTMTRQFSTDVSHELRTPLTAIRGQLEVALFSAQTVEQYQDAIVNALQDVDRLTQTIRALLLLSQAESGQVNLQLQTLNLTTTAADIVDQFQIVAEEAGVSLDADLAPQCPVEADRVQMERLVSNLLSNAIKYTPAGGRVHLSLFCEERTVTLTVSDTGVGISEAHLPHIFDRFYRVPGKDKNPERGLGLGLSFVAWIVKAHGGRIDVQSKPGEGTTFRLHFPIGLGAASSPRPFAQAPAGPH